MPRWHVIDELDVARLVVRHARLRLLCDRVEACADGLPTLPPARALAMLCHDLGGGLAADLSCEHDFLAGNFAALTRLDRSLLGQIADRYAAGSDRAFDVVAALSDGSDLRPPSIETIGYMLRSFFETCRDALAFEELAILKLGHRRLTGAARDMLIACLQRGANH